ncbi:FecR family protein [Sinomicrobium weinanense]|uniref:FecR domain-containing protein n=1 Tax=Sinomicrobium weinanense TaxID=2842200 RepID=A0A926JVK9_9FLAO|nr:FecR domain-containing protein [Sinomicrobium weinanense]MBC9798388.1 FecR domain-containing protein [Sinomicrobium weinanense]MBU3124815.1 FecR domain-containing protein [Sinomicrobium weinanense]
MLRKARIKQLLKKLKTSGEIAPEDLRGLTDAEKEVIRTLYDENLVDESLDFLESLNTDRELEKLKNRLNIPETPVIPMWKYLLKYAAVLAGAITVVYLYQVLFSSPPEYGIAEDAIKLRTGMDREIKVIDQTGSQQFVSASGEVIAEQQGNTIRYKPGAKVDELIFHELHIPYGKIFEVELSDGTQVHLNSGTRIKYPVKFSDPRKREVFIDGEAYFKVAKDKEHPFLVHADAVTVKVLGTEFNISSYREDAEVKTVLIEGSVAMTNSYNTGSKTILKPGTKGSWNRTSHTTRTEKVDIELYTSWTKGELVFRETPFEESLVKLERKYNVTIENRNPGLARKKLNARFSVDVESISDVLKSIGEVFAYNYEIKDRKIVIY